MTWGANGNTATVGGTDWRAGGVAAASAAGGAKVAGVTGGVGTGTGGGGGMVMWIGVVTIGAGLAGWMTGGAVTAGTVAVVVATRAGTVPHGSSTLPC
jgi:hypothetical protein